MCGYKRFSDGSDVQDLQVYKSSPIPGGVPYLDAESKKVVTPKTRKQIKQFKCPRCGRLIRAKKLDLMEPTPAPTLEETPVDFEVKQLPKEPDDKPIDFT
jgi:hypothetical protein